MASASNESMARISSNSTHANDLMLGEILVFSGLFSLISIVGIIGNSLVIAAIAGDSKMRKSTMNALLLNLAAADLCNLMACVPEFAVLLIDRGWVLPDWLCPVLRFLERVFLYTSLLTQLAVGIERFIAIAYPMKVHLLCSRKKVTWWIGLLWLASMISASPYAWNKMIRTKSGQIHCLWIIPMNPKIILSSAECLLFYFLPLLLIVILYSCVSAKLWSRNPHLHEGRRPDSRASETLKTRQNVVKMLIVCICVYFLCYSPIQAIFISHMIFGKQVKFGLRIRLALNCLVIVCSTANPIVYTLYSHRFRRKFIKLLCAWRHAYARSTTPTSNTWMPNTGTAYSTTPTNNNCTGCRKMTRDSDLDCDISSALLTNPRTNPASPMHKCRDHRNSSAVSIQSTTFNGSPIVNGEKKTVLCIGTSVLHRS